MLLIVSPKEKNLYYKIKFVSKKYGFEKFNKLKQKNKNDTNIKF